MNMDIGWSRNQIATLVTHDIPDNSYVNLGIGIPELVAQSVPPSRMMIFHTENGLLGMGPPPAPEDVDSELINAGKKAVTASVGASYCHHADSFVMIRGGHIDFCVLGAMQVSAQGDLANWSLGAKDAMPAVGGAMDLVAGVKNTLVTMQHCTQNGTPKLVENCTLPLTGSRVVNRIYTDLAIIDVAEDGLKVVALAPGVNFDYVRNKTACNITQ